MTDQSVTGDARRRRRTRGRRLMALQELVNRIVRGLLRTPLLRRLAGSRLVTLYIVGRKSGRRYTVPVAYTRHEGDLLIGTPFGWGRNLRTGEPVTIRLKGRRRLADVRVLRRRGGRSSTRTPSWRATTTPSPSSTRSASTPAGNPDPADLRLAWAAGARAFRLTPR